MKLKILIITIFACAIFSHAKTVCLDVRMGTHVYLWYQPGDCWPIFENFIVNENIDSINVNNTDILSFFNSIDSYVTYIDKAPSLSTPPYYLYLLNGYDSSLYMEVENYITSCEEQMSNVSNEYTIELKNGKRVHLEICKIIAWFKAEKTTNTNSDKQTNVGSEHADSILRFIALISAQKPNGNIFIPQKAIKQ